jgi:cyclic-di-GMP-binding protein
MADSSFDVVVETDKQEVDNAINQAKKEVVQRYDFKGTGADVAWSGEQIVITANSEERTNAALDVLKDKLVKRKVSLKTLDAGEPKPAGGQTYRWRSRCGRASRATRPRRW